jgi:glycosyltransferase involved in cell wall biosynthesis
MNRKVTVLLSTFNGEVWLNELLDSLKNQRHVEIELLWRDDGSTDNSEYVVTAYEGIKKIHCDHIKVRVGAAASFMHLLEHEIEAEYISFCDQDDVWDKDKLNFAVEIMGKESATSLAYSSRIRNLKNGELWPKKPITPDPINALMENVMTGCTVVINREFKELLLQFSKPSNLLHDEWIYLVGIFHSEIIYDDNANIGYRVHHNNATGIPAAHRTLSLTNINRYKNIFKLVHRYRLKKRVVCETFNLEEGDIGFKEIQILSTPIIKRRISMARNLNFRQTPFENMICKVLWLIGII